MRPIWDPTHRCGGGGWCTRCGHSCTFLVYHEQSDRMRRECGHCGYLGD